MNQTQADIIKHRLTQADGHLYAVTQALEGRVPESRLEELRKAHQAVLNAISLQDIQDMVTESGPHLLPKGYRRWRHLMSEEEQAKAHEANG